MFSQPMKSRSHKILEALSKRTKLTRELKRLLERLTAGYKGEIQFFNLLKTELRNSPISLFNLHLKINGSECQIDCLLIFQNELVLFEVKNYQGDFFIEKENWYTLSKREIRNPLHQLHRTDLLLRQLLSKQQSPLNIKSFIVFTHPEFHLYQAPIDIPVVFPTQLKRFINKRQNTACRIQKQHHNLASLLKSSHQTSSPYESLPQYDYTALKKGVTCGKCDGFMLVNSQNNMSCAKCGFIEDFREAIMRSVLDFHSLFPDEKIQVRTIADWTNNSVSKHRIRTTLSRYCVAVARGKSSYYVFDEESPRLR